MISRHPLSYKDALYVFKNADPVVLAEWNSILEFPTAEERVSELIGYSKFKWCLKMNGRPVAIYGATRVTKTTLMGWCLTVHDARKMVWAQMAREIRNVIKLAFDTGVPKRIDLVVCTDRPEPESYAHRLGMLRVGDLPYYGEGKNFMLMGVTYREVEE